MLLLYLTPVRGAGITQTTYLWNFHVGIWMNSRELLTGELRRTPLPKLSGKCSAGVMMAYAPRYGEQEIPHGSVRRRMGLHRPASARSYAARSSQASRLTGDPRRRLLRA